MSADTPLMVVPDGFNEFRICRSGPMLYNKHDIYVGGSLRKYGEFSHAETTVFAQVLRSPSIAVEVGANIGAHTIDISRMVGDGGEVHAFEPQRIPFQTLCANLALNQCANVYARQAAAGSGGGNIIVPSLDPSQPANFGGVTLIGATGGDLVPIMTVDSLDLPACHLLKVDVEGMEVDVVKGALETIDAYRPILYLENDREEKSEALLELILGLDYAAYWHLAELFNPGNFAGDAENIFPGIVSINILCIPAEIKMSVAGTRQVRSPQDSWRVA